MDLTGTYFCLWQIAPSPAWNCRPRCSLVNSAAACKMRVCVCVISSVAVVLCVYCRHRQPSVALAQGHATHLMWHVSSILACPVTDGSDIRISATFDVLMGNQWSSLVEIGNLPEYGSKVVKVYVHVRLLMTCASSRLQSSVTGQNCDMVHWLVV